MQGGRILPYVHKAHHPSQTERVEDGRDAQSFPRVLPAGGAMCARVSHHDSMCASR